jgi:hypothetical protein
LEARESRSMMADMTAQCTCSFYLDETELTNGYNITDVTDEISVIAHNQLYIARNDVVMTDDGRLLRL